MRHTTGCAVILNEDYHEDKEQRYFKSRINPLKLLTTDKTWLIAETWGSPVGPASKKQHWRPGSGH